VESARLDSCKQHHTVHFDKLFERHLEDVTASRRLHVTNVGRFGELFRGRQARSREITQLSHA
jgi:hypothetical protein